MACLIFVDVEAVGSSPFSGNMTQFGAVLFEPDADVTACAEIEFSGKLRSRNGKPMPEDRYDHEDQDESAQQTADAVHVRLLSIMYNFDTWIKMCSVGRGAPKFVSDNPAYDWQWISYAFDQAGIVNPFGYSARRLGDFYAGLVGDFFRTQQYKLLRVTKHDHNPVHDARGNAEAFHRLIQGERPPLITTKEQRKEFY